MDLIKEESLRDLIKEEVNKSDVLKAASDVVKNTYLIKVLATPDAANSEAGDVKYLYTNWDMLDAVTKLSSMLLVAGFGDHLFQLAESYLDMLSGERFGSDVNAIAKIPSIRERNELLALIALYYYAQ